MARGRRIRCALRGLNLWGAVRERDLSQRPGDGLHHTLVNSQRRGARAVCINLVRSVCP